MIRSRRIKIVHALLALFALAVIGQAAHVQLLQRNTWRARAARQQLAPREMPAPRGEILDAAGLVLAQSREMVQLEVAPREVRAQDRVELHRALARVQVKPEWIRRALDPKRAWVTLPGRYLATDVAWATRIRGVRATAASVRAYAMSEGTRRLVGHVDAQNSAVDGIELALDTILRGTAGTATLVRDVRGRSFESPNEPQVAPRPGNTVVLTLNHELQEIAERALADAVEKMGADGGDIVVLDPQEGDILAMASRRQDQRSTAATALTEPFEPGSTLKPFIAAGLLARGRARETDVINTGDGTLQLEGRVIHDDHLVGRASLATVLQWSSNIGIVKFAQRLTRREEFETLRDFGFGTATGVPYPSEASGVLREPSKWSPQSPASLAMGYEISVTPLQLAVAYAAFANGGELVEPALVKEIRAPDGSVLYRHQKRVVRRVLTPDVATRIRKILLNVVENGTALQADLSSFLLAGKTGTPRRTVNGRYAAQQYNPNFAGLFPGDAPQFVIVVKLTNPRDQKGSFYSAATAAPLTKTVLQAALAARDAALDRDKLASSAGAAAVSTRPDTRADAAPPVQLAVAGDTTTREAGGIYRARQRAREEASTGDVAFIVSLPQRHSASRPPQAARLIPDIRGMPLRDAVLSLHNAGFHVRVVSGTDGATDPAAGSVAPAGAVVRLFHDF
ncbi:MAG TPA: penicillin-binding transpeptidase domain-containing protein [Gemmatimonadaceae bacterium]|jgi:cell division protein FtsI (penicillin-binding protein 3)